VSATSVYVTSGAGSGHGRACIDITRSILRPQTGEVDRRKIMNVDAIKNREPRRTRTGPPTN